MKPKKDRVREIANSAILTLGNRISGPLILGISMWMLHTMIDIKTDMAGMVAKVDAQGTELGILETWRNTFDAHAETIRHR